MRILHSSDWHVTEGKRFDEAVDVLRSIVKHGIDAGVDAWFVPGDFFGTAVPHRSSPRERLAVADIFGSMADHAPVFAVYGNHCFPEDLELLARLRAKLPIVVASRPTVVTAGAIRAYLMPYPSKRFFLANDSVKIDIAGQTLAMEGGLRAILAAWRLDAEQARDRGEYPVAAMHLNVAGSATAGGEVLIGQEIELSKHDLDELGMDYVALGHLHLQQRVADRAWYCGSPYGQSFGEPDRKAFLVIDLEHGADPVVTSVPTPARRILTVRYESREGRPHFLGMDQDCGSEICMGEEYEGAEVRVLVEVGEDEVATFPFDRIEEDVRSLGAHSVKLERRILPKTRVRSEAITKAVTLEEQLDAYFESLATPPDAEQRARVLEKLAELHTEPVAHEAAA